MRVSRAAILTMWAIAMTAVGVPASGQGLEFGPPETKKKPAASKPVKTPPAATQNLVPTPAPATPATTGEATAKGTTSPGTQVATPAPQSKPAQLNSAGPATTGLGTTQLPPKPAPANCKTAGTFEGWLAVFRKEVTAEGLSPKAIAEVLDGLTLDPGVISRDRKQGVFMLSFLEFSAKLATNNRMQAGKAKIGQNKSAFDRVEKQFGVPASVITGFWALESDFGGGMGNLPILRSIATLAYDCRRGPMFREELKAVIRIVERGDMSPSEMVGSWAGEIGQTQFLPTRYLEHAIDYDGDGKANLFRNNTDIIGTTANYMSHLGWRPNEPWLEEVLVPDELPWDQADLAIKIPRSQWAKWGVTRVGGAALQSDSLSASLMLPMGRHGPAFLAYENFGVYLKWNQSLTYATTAAYLATRIDGAPPMQRGRPNIPMLSAEEAKELQRQLVKRGYDVGEIDGRLGAATRTAVKAVQKKFNMPADSYPTPELLTALRGS
ncbi:MAG: lytic murein transglycosylase [Hyphomicrobium sp.]